MTTFRKIVPDSTIRPLNERYEHFLVWLSKNGGVRQWFFSHSEGREEENYKGFVVESLTEIRNVPNEDRVIHRCMTRFMDSGTFDYVSSIFASNKVYKVTKSGEQIPIAVMPTKTRRPNQIKNFEIDLQFELKEEDILNV